MKSGESSDNNRAFWKRFDAAAKIFLWTFFSSPLSNLILKLCGKGGFGPYKACLNWEKWAIINFSIQTNADLSSNFLADSDKFRVLIIWFDVKTASGESENQSELILSRCERYHQCCQQVELEKRQILELLQNAPHFGAFY